jgi:hypothetical protein
MSSTGAAPQERRRRLRARQIADAKLPVMQIGVKSRAAPYRTMRAPRGASQAATCAVMRAARAREARAERAWLSDGATD